MGSSETNLPDGHKAGRKPIRWVRAALLGSAAGLLSLLAWLILFKPLQVLPIIAESPDFSLVDQRGQRVNAADLRGHVVLANFVYTHCSTVCPASTAEMLRMAHDLQTRGWLGDDVLLVTFSFDPERDTPDRLLEYAELLKAPQDGWLWLTGDPLDVRRLVGAEFGVYFERIPGPTPDQYEFAHEATFVLIDAGGRLRAEYPDLLGFSHAPRDVALVVREKNSGPLLSSLLRIGHLLHLYPS